MLHAPPNQKGITMRLVVGRYTNLRVRGRSILRKRSRYPSHQLESLEPTNPATLLLHPVPLSTLPPSTPLPPWLQNVKSLCFGRFIQFHSTHLERSITGSITSVKSLKFTSLSGACRGELMKSFGEPAGLGNRAWKGSNTAGLNQSGWTHNKIVTVLRYLQPLVNHI